MKHELKLMPRITSGLEVPSDNIKADVSNNSNEPNKAYKAADKDKDIGDASGKLFSKTVTDGFPSIVVDISEEDKEYTVGELKGLIV